MKIADLTARQIFDSRGEPTVEVQLWLRDGSYGVGSAPAGASTGSAEVAELRDGGDAYGGRGVQRAIEGLRGAAREAILGMDAARQDEIDARLREIEAERPGTLGGNGRIAASWAVADAAARSAGLPLYQWLGGVRARELPCPMFNVINGGRHANNSLEVQEFMFVPAGADSFHEAMRMGAECYRALGRLLRDAGLSAAVGDEGGFAPDLESDVAALEWMLRAIEAAGWRCGEDVCLALDCAASEWVAEDGYRQLKSGARFQRAELIEHYGALAGRFPLIAIEDPLGEADFEGFREITDALGGDVLIVGDDLFATNPERLLRGAAMGAANALLVKPNQIGSVSEALEAVRLARSAGYAVVASHRSGETLSSAIADLAVAVGAEYIKAGAPARGERLAKYNRLLAIEDMLD